MTMDEKMDEKEELKDLILKCARAHRDEIPEFCKDCWVGVKCAEVVNDENNG